MSYLEPKKTQEQFAAEAASFFKMLTEDTHQRERANMLTGYIAEATKAYAEQFSSTTAMAFLASLRLSLVPTGGTLKQTRLWTMREIAEQICDSHGVAMAELMGPSKRKYIARARQHFMAEAYATGRWSTISIGKFIGRDHTTVLHGIRAHHGKPRNRKPQTIGVSHGLAAA